MDENKVLIIVKGEDKTEDILSIDYDPKRPMSEITYHGYCKEYTYYSKDIVFLSNPEEIEIYGKLILKQEIPCQGLDKILKFSSYAKLFYKTGYKEVISISKLKILDSALNDSQIKNNFEYFKAIAEKVGLKTEDHNILYDRYEKIEFIREDSILAPYLQGEIKDNPVIYKNYPIFPFGFNMSQKKAVENALKNRLSIIEGPPGTGKTQTILNIIANAIIEGKSVAVVSGNNSATANVLEKLNKYGVGFLAAYLGSFDNKQNFIENQILDIKGIDDWKISKQEVAEKSRLYRNNNLEIEQKLLLKVELSELETKLDYLGKEYSYFCDIYDKRDSQYPEPRFKKRLKNEQILQFIAEYELKTEEKKRIGIWNKTKWHFKYGFANYRFLRDNSKNVIFACQNVYYLRQINELKQRIKELSTILCDFEFDQKMEQQVCLSGEIFKAKLYKKYENRKTRETYNLETIRLLSEQFIQDYPVVLSTTYSLRSSLDNDFVYDYVIMDESSQVDLASGVLALSCAKRAVIVGDLKQLPNVVNSETKRNIEEINKKYSVKNEYLYSENSFLSSVVKLFPNVPRVLLKEHYRCHPEIIGFCNRRFYNDELLVMTKPQSNKPAMMVYRTVAGNHARKHYNQRQIDVIKQEVIPQQQLDISNNSVGIVTPYRDQAEQLQAQFRETTVKADTVDKFQGQERQVMILSTVDNEIGEFVSNPNRLNVAVSRAIEQFIVVTDGNNNDNDSHIHDLISYIQYHNHEIINSRVSSVFDYLYSQYADAREKLLKKYGRVTYVESENLMFLLIKEILNMPEFNHLGCVLHLPLKSILKDLSILQGRELNYAANEWTHIDFLIFSKLSHMPVLAIEVDGFKDHNADNLVQQERDALKNAIMLKYDIPIIRLSTIGSGEKPKIISALKNNKI